MHRQSQEEVAAAARRRLELLGRELEQAGLRRVDEADVAAAPSLPEPSPVMPAGRHARRRFARWVGDQVPDTLRGRTELSLGPVVLVVALVALAVTGTVFVVLRMDGDSEPVPIRATTSAPGSATPSAKGAAGSAPGADVTVDIAGKVRRPGVARLPAGSRVVDALRQAGGARAGVDLSSLNLARVLVDGEQILVGRAAPAGGLAASASTAAPDPVGSLVNLNTATAAQLDTLPGVGPVTAQKILDWRSAHGAFSAVDELLEVDGIGEKTLADMAPHVTL